MLTTNKGAVKFLLKLAYDTKKETHTKKIDTYLLHPKVLRYIEELLHVNLSKAICAQSAVFRNVTQRSINVARFVITSAQHPVQNARVFSKTGPKEFTLEGEVNNYLYEILRIEDMHGML